MSTDLLILGLLWSASFIYPNFISMIFEPMLVGAVISTGICYGFVHYLKRGGRHGRDNTLTESSVTYVSPRVLLGMQTASAYFLPLLLLLLMRSCLFDVSRVVSGSLKPTVLVGDTILINKYRYGIRLPMTGNVIVPISSPKRGDIVAFRFPQNSSKVFIKRVIGLPNDEIKYAQKQLRINGELVKQSVLAMEQIQENGRSWVAIKSEEDLPGRKHMIYSGLYNPAEILPSTFSRNQDEREFSLKIPSGHYFVMGDNRDNSLDSRHWGCVSDRHLLGEVRRVVFSIKINKGSSPLTWIRWKRFGTPIV